jgi:hypothetical protein
MPWSDVKLVRVGGPWAPSVAWCRRGGRERRHVFFADAERFTRQVVLGQRVGSRPPRRQ